MRKILFYISTLTLLYLIYIIINIFVYHFENLNNYGNGFLIGKIILLFTFAYLMYRTNPFETNKRSKKQN